MHISPKTSSHHFDSWTCSSVLFRLVARGVRWAAFWERINCFVLSRQKLQKWWQKTLISIYPLSIRDRDPSRHTLVLMPSMEGEYWWRISSISATFFRHREQPWQINILTCHGSHSLQKEQFSLENQSCLPKVLVLKGIPIECCI